jgi:UDP-N-acetylmuramoylalanine--D-glutamate ligase
MTQMAQTSWRGKTILIIGAARQGLALARYLVQHGAQVILNDRRPLADLSVARQTLSDLPTAALRWETGEHPLHLLDGVDLVCLSGGIDPRLPLVQAAQQRGLPLANDSQIFLEACPCPVIGITGSAGKTTTTTLVGRMAQAAAQLPGGPRRAWVGGNIGAPLIAVLDEIEPDDVAVMELSSFQLELMTRSPHLAALLNLTPNHLDRHGTMEAYAAAKARILAFQQPEDRAILGQDDAGAWALRSQVRGELWAFGLHPGPQAIPGVFVMGGQVVLLQPGEKGTTETPLLSLFSIMLRGEHNLRNVLAACAIGAAAGWPTAALQAGVQGFTGVPHRLEWVRQWRGTDWYNDSIATTPERTLAAIRSFDEPLVLLCGGRDKHLPWEEFAALVRRRVSHLVVFGEAAELIAAAVEAAPPPPGCSQVLTGITCCPNLSAAVAAAAQIVQPGDVVLLSPGGTSFDEFSDFEERGACFVQLVNDLG